MLEIVPVTFQEACAFIREHHRHHPPPRGWKFGCGCYDTAQAKLVGVVVVARPVSRQIQAREPFTLEVVRNCTDGTPHVASKLYAAAWRAARALGYRRLITYILDSEAGTSLVAAGGVPVYKTRGEGWNRPSRERANHGPTCPKTLYEW